MKRKYQFILFIIIAMACAAAIMMMKSPFRNQIPVIWMVYGFIFNAVLTGLYWSKVNERLITDYKDVLKQLRISVFTMGGWTRIDNFTLLTNKKLPQAVDAETREWLRAMKFHLMLVVIAFVLFPCLAILVIY